MKKRRAKKLSMKKYFFKSGKQYKSNSKYCSCNGGIYFFGLLGAVIYYLQTATSFWGGVLGILKSFIWPVFLVYELFKSVTA